MVVESTTSPRDRPWLLDAQESRSIADVFYSEAENDRCTLALLLTIDSIDLVRPKPGIPHGGGWLDTSTTDPTLASSHLSVAIASVLGSALAGTSKERPELAERTIPLEAREWYLPEKGQGSFRNCSSRSAIPLISRDTHWMAAFLSGGPAPTSACASRRHRVCETYWLTSTCFCRC